MMMMRRVGLGPVCERGTYLNFLGYPVVIDSSFTPDLIQIPLPSPP